MGLNFLRSSIWTPDIVLLNAAGNGDEGLEKRTLVKVPLQISFFNVICFLPIQQGVDQSKELFSDRAHWPRDIAHSSNLCEQVFGERDLSTNIEIL